MTVGYQKDEGTGIVAITCNGSTSLTASKRPAEGTLEVSEWVKARNHSGKVCIPGDGVPYVVVVKALGVETIVDSGVTNAPVEGTVTPILVRTRHEEAIVEPVDQAAEVL